MDVSFYIAKKYVFSKSGNSAINIMTFIAAIGTVVASAALFVVLSGFDGLKEFSTEFSSLSDPDIKLQPKQGKSFFTSDSLEYKLQNFKNITSYSYCVEEKTILRYDNKNALATIKGVDQRFLNVTNVDSLVVLGKWLKENTSQTVAGWGLAKNLGFGILDYGKSIMAYVPKPGTGQVTSVKNAFNSQRIYNTGLFDINETLNNEYIFADINFVRKLLSYKPSQVTAVEIKVLDLDKREETIGALKKSFGNIYTVKTREELNDSLHKMLQTENVAVYFIFTLVLIVALFNVIGVIIMMILDKKSSLKTLYSIGASIKNIKNIFFLQGSFMAILSGGLGLFIGFLLILFQQKTAFFMITPSLPYPVSLNLFNALVVILTISSLGVIASKLASMRISKKLLES